MTLSDLYTQTIQRHNCAITMIKCSKYFWGDTSIEGNSKVQKNTYNNSRGSPKQM